MERFKKDLKEPINGAYKVNAYETMRKRKPCPALKKWNRLYHARKKDRSWPLDRWQRWEHLGRRSIIPCWRTKQEFGKQNGRQGYHFVISFQRRRCPGSGL